MTSSAGDTPRSAWARRDTSASRIRPNRAPRRAMRCHSTQSAAAPIVRSKPPAASTKVRRTTHAHDGNAGRQASRSKRSPSASQRSSATVWRASSTSDQPQCTASSVGFAASAPRMRASIPGWSVSPESRNRSQGCEPPASVEPVVWTTSSHPAIDCSQSDASVVSVVVASPYVVITTDTANRLRPVSAA